MTAGYSGTPLPKKLGLSEGNRVAIVDAPSGFENLLGPLPDRAEQVSLRGKRLDLILLFVTSRSRFGQRLPAACRALAPDGALWVCWPKRASRVTTDMTEDVVRELGLPTGLVDNKVAAIDETWSGLRMVVRKENRATWQQ